MIELDLECDLECVQCHRTKLPLVAIGHIKWQIEFVWVCRDCILLALMAFEEVPA